jgi:hypothetical protein
MINAQCSLFAFARQRLGLRHAVAAFDRLSIPTSLRGLLEKLSSAKDLSALPPHTFVIGNFVIPLSFVPLSFVIHPAPLSLRG